MRQGSSLFICSVGDDEEKVIRHLHLVVEDDVDGRLDDGDVAVADFEEDDSFVDVRSF